MHNRSGKSVRAVPDQGYMVNNRIKAREVRLISDDGQNLGLTPLDQALDMAKGKGLDLVQISEGASGIVAKIMDFGKFLYEKKKQLSVAKKNQKVIQIKELKFRPRIDEGDYRLRIKKAGEFLSSGKRVKFTIQFRGREIPMMAKLGAPLFERIQKDLESMGFVGLIAEKESRGTPTWSKIFYLKEK